MTAEILIKYIRDGLVEQEHYGYLMVSDKKRIIDSHGEAKDAPFYLRSCAKPLQASLVIDYGVDKYFDLTSEGIIKSLDLRRPIYKQTAAYGHFGRTDVELPWEKLDKADELKAVYRKY